MKSTKNFDGRTKSINDALVHRTSKRRVAGSARIAIIYWLIFSAVVAYGFAIVGSRQQGSASQNSFLTLVPLAIPVCVAIIIGIVASLVSAKTSWSHAAKLEARKKAIVQYMAAFFWSILCWFTTMGVIGLLYLFGMVEQEFAKSAYILADCIAAVFYLIGWSRIQSMRFIGLLPFVGFAIMIARSIF